ncbi:MAG: hypothetical protein ABI543_13980 [Ignavibacteria bacterium]
MKFLAIIFSVFALSFTLQSQDFKEVKTAQDVVDNYLIASGGAYALRSVESISMKGKIGDGEESGSVGVFFSKKYFYMDISTKKFAMKQVVDMEAKKGWTKFGTMMKDMTEEDITKNRKNAENSMWSNFLDPKSGGITFELLQNESVNGSDAYVVDQLKDGTSATTSYFDAKTFLKVKEIKGNMTNEFSDFRKTGKNDIVMPYKVKSQSGDVTISEIKFNGKFDKKLLKKPEEDSK